MRTGEEGLLLGTRKGLFFLERGGAGWEVERLAHRGDPVAYAMEDPRTGTLWACIDHGHWGQKLTRSRDGGETWETLPGPKFPEDAEIKPGKPATLRYLWCLAPGGRNEPDRLYAGTEPGGLFRSDDGGETFQLVEGLWNHPSRPDQWFGGGRDEAGIHSILVDPRDSRRILVGISCAGVFESTDAGETWVPRNHGLVADFLPDPEPEVGFDPHLLGWCEAAPDVLWQQNHCGIFRSTDAARSWQPVSEPGGPAHFGFAVAVDPEHPETAWVVPAEADGARIAHSGALCVCRSDDGGRSWSALRAGLPQEHCYDIVLRHALDLRGDSLAFGSTTGNVFVSGDRGDNWSSLGSHFPPVYSVRFRGG